MKMFDLSSQSVTITPGMHFSYWILPQSPKNTGLVSGSNSAFVALDLIFTDGTELRDSALTDQHSVSVNPQYQGSILVLATWNYVTVDMTPLAGKTVNRVDLGYNQPGGTGGYRGYVDDIAFTTPATAAANIALNRPASGDSQQGGNLAGNGNDGNNGTRWSANYIFKRSAGSGGEVSIGSTTNTVYADTGLTNGTTYYYVVAAQNLLGQSGNSAEVAATPQPPVPGSYAATLVADHPLAYWPLNETNGTAAYDLVGGHNGTYVGGVTLGQPGVPLAGFITPDYAALFNGTSGYVDIPEGPFNITGVITMVAWINVPVAPGFSDIIGHGDGSWCMSVDASGQPGGSDGNVGDATGSASIVGAGWKMVAYTYTGVNTGNNGSLYVNGTLAACRT